MKKFLIMIVIMLTFTASACGRKSDAAMMNNLSSTPVEVINVPLSGPMKAARAEVSGLALWNDAVVLLPQYPEQYASDQSDGAIFYLPVQDITDSVENSGAEDVKPAPIQMDLDGLVDQISGYEGFESLVFVDEAVFFTIEAKQTQGMMGYIVKGMVSEKSGEWWITLDSDSLTEIAPQVDIDNMTDEAIMAHNGTIYTFYEANGASVNSNPVVHRFSIDLEPLDSIPMTHVPFRLTDVSQPDTTGNFWGMNYFYPSDTPVQGDFGQDPFSPLAPNEQIPGVVERIIPLVVTEKGSVVMGDNEVVSLSLLSDEARNWEGLVLVPGSGFVIVTDRYPTTILGYVPLP